jgi:hypothetical protein
MEYSLNHSGIKGMRWGIRRYQNKDGSLTALGRRRYKLQEKKAQADAEKAKREGETVEAKKERILKSRSAKELYENADLFSTNELQNAYNRLQLERNISGLIPKETKPGKEFLENTSSTAKSLVDLTGNVTKLYNNVAKVYNSVPELNKGRDPLPVIGEGKSGKKDKKKDDDDDD